MKKMPIIVSILTIFFLASCSFSQLIEGLSKNSGSPQPTATTNVIVNTPPVKLTLQAAADRTIAALKQKNLTALADLVDPDRGVRFSPYAYVTDNNKVFYPSELSGLLDSDQIFSWGNYDGSGKPIELTFSEYYNEFVYSADFANADQVAIDERLGEGNTINNIPDFYPGSSFVEYYIAGSDPQYEGMDWQSLRLVFIQQDGVWYLIGIAHDEWTI